MQTSRVDQAYRDRRRPGRRSKATVVAAAVAVLVVIALAVVALNRGTRPAATATDEAPAAAEGAGGSAAGDFLAFTATDARTVTVPDSGPDAKPVVVFFMASWCASCIEEARAMTALETEYTDRGRFVAVEVTPNAPPQEIAKFQAAAGNPAHPYLVDRRGDLTSAYGVTVLDTTVVLAPDGEVLDRQDGRPMDEETLRAFLDHTLT